MARRCIRAGISSDNSSSSSSLTSVDRDRADEPGLAARVGERPDPEDIGSALGHADRTSRIEEVEEMARFQALVVSRQREPMVDQRPALGLGIAEMHNEAGSIGKLKIVGREFLLGALEDLAVCDTTRPAGSIVVEVKHALDTLDIHSQPFEPVGQLGRNRVAFDTADLLEIGELADLHAVEPNLPTKPPGTQGRALPIIFDKADVVETGINADRC